MYRIRALVEILWAALTVWIGIIILWAGLGYNVTVQEPDMLSELEQMLADTTKVVNFKGQKSFTYNKREVKIYWNFALKPTK